MHQSSSTVVATTATGGGGGGVASSVDINARQRRATIPLSSRSFDAIRLVPVSNMSHGRRSAVDRGFDPSAAPSSGPIPSGADNTGRRGSFLYRSADAVSDLSPMSISRRLSAADVPIEDVIVTPFAQILHSLRAVHANFMIITGIAATPNEKSRQKCAASCQATEIGGLSASSVPMSGYLLNDTITEQEPSHMNDVNVKLAAETLEELEWCLHQLEKVRTHRPVADMATTKFRRMLNRELNHFSGSSTSGNEISEYICSTFLESQDEIQVSSVFNIEEESAVDTLSRRRSRQDSTCTNVSTVVDAHVDVHLTVAAQLAQLEPTALNGGGVLSDSRTDELSEAMNMWGPDIFRINEVTNSRPLTAVVYRIFRDIGAMPLLQIEPATLVLYLTLLENNYKADNPYHNNIHATDVAQSVYVLIRRPAFKDVFSGLELLAAVFAGAVHDVDHPGVTNQYLINLGRELAVLYNDQSVLENHHLAVAFKLLQTIGADIFQNLPVKSYQAVRRLVIEMVLATDMSKHMELVADLKTMVETRRVAGSDVPCFDNGSNRIQVLKTLVHCADLSNPTKPLKLYLQWTERIMAEFFRQGDMEREQGLEVSPMCDRYQPSVNQSQIGFIEFIAYPLWETWAELVYPDCVDVLENIRTNLEWFQSQVQQQQDQSGTLTNSTVVEEENEDFHESELTNGNDRAAR